MAKENISNLLTENRSFPPPEAFAEQAICGSLEDYKRLYDESIDSPETFWGRVADELHWFRKWAAFAVAAAGAGSRVSRLLVLD